MTTDTGGGGGGGGTNGDLLDVRVFISYPRGGSAHSWAERLQAELDARHAEAWRDETDIDQGDANWYERIRRALDRADVVVCVLDAASDRCRWQQREILYADRLTTPVLVLRTADVAPPLALIEKQPVEVRRVEEAPRAWAHLAEQIAALQPQASRSADPQPIDAARQRELSWLQDLLHGDLSDREARYIEIAARESRAPGAERALKGLRMPTSLLFEAFGVNIRPGAPAQEAATKPYDDVLAAYRDLPRRPVKRAVVLGEPGAGKTFSLERIACETARAALRNPAAPLPLLVRLGLWTRDEPLQAFIESQLGDLGRDFLRLRDAGRAVLLLDAANEIPPGQRRDKAQQIRRMAEDDRFAAVLLSCRARDFEADLQLPFDRLTLQPLTPPQIHRFIRAALAVGLDPAEAEPLAEACFWRIAGGETLREFWRTWEEAGATFDLFWTADAVPKSDPTVITKTSGEQERRWREARSTRGLLRLAGNPYLLEIMMRLPAIPPNRAQLFAGFIRVLHQRELEARDRRHEQTPDFGAWRAALVALAEALQRADGRPGGGDSTQTALALADCPSSLSATLIDFSIDASVLQRVGDSLRFTHQLLQESLAADVLLDAAKTGSRPASDFWPQSRWWQRSGWEVVAEIAAEACEGDVPAQLALIRWLALDHPGLAADVWLHIDRPALPPDLLSQTAAQWRPRLTDVVAEPAPAARAAIGRWLGLLDLDDRRGVGLGSDGLPDIDWVEFDDCLSFTYQGTKHPGLPPFALSRHLVTNRQFQAFVDSPDGYAAPRWWSDVHDQLKPSLRPATWPEANCPRENVNWFEAVAFCRWLTEHLHRSGRLPLSQVISLPTEHQWERAARGRRGLPFPNSGVYIIESINYEERNSIGAGTSLLRTCAVGLYPQSATQEGGLLDMLGNVSEWCSDTYSPKLESDGIRLSLAARVHRGGCWNSSPVRMSTLARDLHSPLGRHNGLGFRVCRTSPSESRASGR